MSLNIHLVIAEWCWYLWYLSLLRELTVPDTQSSVVLSQKVLKSKIRQVEVWLEGKGEYRNILDQLWWCEECGQVVLGKKVLILCWSLEDKSGIIAQTELWYISCFKGKYISLLWNGSDSISWYANVFLKQLAYKPRNTSAFLLKIMCDG